MKGKYNPCFVFKISYIYLQFSREIRTFYIPLFIITIN